MSDLQARAEQLLSRITAGRWFGSQQRSSHDCYDHETRIGAELQGYYAEHYIGRIYEDGNAAFIAAAPQLVSELLACLTAQDTEIAALRAEVEQRERVAFEAGFYQARQREGA